MCHPKHDIYEIGYLKNNNMNIMTLAKRFYYNWLF